MKITKHLPAFTVACVLGFAPAAFAQSTMSQMPGMAPITNAPAAAASAVTSSVTDSANNAASAATSSATNAANNAANSATSAVTNKVDAATGSVTNTVKSVTTPLTKAQEFKTAAEAATGCPNDTVVWASMGKSKAYHLSSSKLYGKTKHGAYVCKATADAAGYHQAKN